jgi:hypothetical protein
MRSLSARYGEEMAGQVDDASGARLPFGQAAVIIAALSLFAWGLILAPCLLM